MNNLRKKLAMMLATLRNLFSISGIDSLSFFAKRAELKSLTQQGECVQKGTPTPSVPVPIVCNNGVLKWDSVNERIYADGTPESIAINQQVINNLPDLLGVVNYKDSYDIVSGLVRHKAGVKVFDGTEKWTIFSESYPNLYRFNINNSPSNTQLPGIMSHFSKTSHNIATMQNGSFQIPKSSYYTMVLVKSSISNLQDFNQFLADQYNAGTPVVIVYPLATATTETVTAQPLELTEGTNIIEVTQASLTGLEIEAEVEAAAFAPITN